MCSFMLLNTGMRILVYKKTTNDLDLVIMIPQTDLLNTISWLHIYNHLLRLIMQLLWNVMMIGSNISQRFFRPFGAGQNHCELQAFSFPVFSLKHWPFILFWFVSNNNDFCIIFPRPTENHFITRGFIILHQESLHLSQTVNNNELNSVSFSFQNTLKELGLVL